MSDNQKQLTFSQVKKDSKKYKEKIRVELDNGEFYVDIYPNFEPKKIKAMMFDIGQVFNFASENNIDLPNEVIYDFIYCFIIKHFSSIPSPTDHRKLIQGFIDLINSDYFIQIVEAYPQESVEKVFDLMLNGMTNVSQVEHRKNAILNNLINKEITSDINDSK